MRYFDHDWTRRRCQGLASNVESERAHCLPILAVLGSWVSAKYDSRKLIRPKENRSYLRSSSIPVCPTQRLIRVSSSSILR